MAGAGARPSRGRPTCCWEKWPWARRLAPRGHALQPGHPGSIDHGSLALSWSGVTSALPILSFSHQLIFPPKRQKVKRTTCLKSSL